MTSDQIAALRSVDDDAKWAVAEAYRDRQREGRLHLPCHRAGELALARKRPDLSDEQIGSIVVSIMLWISKEHQDWLRSG